MLQVEPLELLKRVEKRKIDVLLQVGSELPIELLQRPTIVHTRVQRSLVKVLASQRRVREG